MVFARQQSNVVDLNSWTNQLQGQGAGSHSRPANNDFSSAFDHLADRKKYLIVVISDQFSKLEFRLYPL